MVMAKAELSGDVGVTGGLSTPSFSVFDSFSISSVDYLVEYPYGFFLVNFTNISDLAESGDEPELGWEIPLGVFLTILCLVTFTGNAMVLHAVRTERRLQSVSFKHSFNYYLVCVSEHFGVRIVDTITLLICFS